MLILQKNRTIFNKPAGTQVDQGKLFAEKCVDPVAMSEGRGTSEDDFCDDETRKKIEYCAKGFSDLNDELRDLVKKASDPALWAKVRNQRAQGQLKLGSDRRLQSRTAAW